MIYKATKITIVRNTRANTIGMITVYKRFEVVTPSGERGSVE